jgi:hypothetical protein
LNRTPLVQAKFGLGGEDQEGGKDGETNAARRAAPRLASGRFRPRPQAPVQAAWQARARGGGAGGPSQSPTPRGGAACLAVGCQASGVVGANQRARHGALSLAHDQVAFLCLEGWLSMQEDWLPAGSGGAPLAGLSKCESQVALESGEQALLPVLWRASTAVGAAEDLRSSATSESLVIAIHLQDCRHHSTLIHATGLLLQPQYIQLNWCKLFGSRPPTRTAGQSRRRRARTRPAPRRAGREGVGISPRHDVRARCAWPAKRRPCHPHRARSRGGIYPRGLCLLRSSDREFLRRQAEMPATVAKCNRIPSTHAPGPSLS